MAFDIEPVDATFGAIVRGVRLNALDQGTWTALYSAWLEYALLIFPDQQLTRGEQKAFARRFGPLEIEELGFSNVRPDGNLMSMGRDRELMNVLEGNHRWHTDSSFKEIHAKGAVFCAETVPPGGTQTGWADMRAAYDALSPGMRERIEHLSAYHSVYRSQEKIGHTISPEWRAQFGVKENSVGMSARSEAPPPLRPLVKVHPETGRNSLLIGRHAYGIPGRTEEESENLLKESTDFACQPARVFYYNWNAGDAVVWVNRCLLHRSVPWDTSLPRVMWHTRIAGDPVTEAALVQ